MIHCWICARVDTGLGRIENVNVRVKSNTYIILSKADRCHLWHFYLLPCTFGCVWQMFLSSCRRTCWPRPRPKTLTERWIFSERMWCRPTPQGIDWLICLPVCLRYSTCRSSTVCCLRTISVLVSTCLSSALTSLFFSSSVNVQLPVCSPLSFNHFCLYPFLVSSLPPNIYFFTCFC